MTLLQIVKDACDELGIPRPTVAYNSTDDQIRQLVRLAQNEGRSLAKRHAWQALKTEHSFEATATDVQVASSLPSDLGWIIAGSMFNRTTRREVEGPMDSVEWQRYKATLVTHVNPIFRVRGNRVLISPVPTSGDVYYYEYASKKWCQSNAGVAQVAWAADNDTGILDESLMTLGLVWRWRAAKGLPFTEQLAAYEREVNDAITRDGSRPRLSANRTNAPVRGLQIPETLER